MNCLYISPSFHLFSSQLPLCKTDLMIMKNFLVLFVASLLIVPALQADAKRLTAEDKLKLMAKRQLVSQTNNSGQKANVTPNTAIPDVDANKNTAIPDAKTGSSTNVNGEGDDSNPRFHQYGNSNASTPNSHHYFTIASQKPSSDPRSK